MSEWKKRLFQLINHDYRGRKKIYKQKKNCFIENCNKDDDRENSSSNSCDLIEN